MDGSISLDYASTIELNQLPFASYTLDSEILRLRFRPRTRPRPARLSPCRRRARRRLRRIPRRLPRLVSPHLRLHCPRARLAAAQRPSLRDPPPERPLGARSPSDLFLGDVRLGAGYRFVQSRSTVLSVTLPTSTAPAGYGRGVISVSVLNTLHLRPHPRLVVEGGLGLGYTPPMAILEAVQHEAFVSANGGARYPLLGQAVALRQPLLPLPYYHDTSLPGLDRRELSLDFGWLLATRAGGEWRIGMTEDLEPSGPGIDLVFRLGTDLLGEGVPPTRRRTGTAPCCGRGIPWPADRAG